MLHNVMVAQDEDRVLYGHLCYGTPSQIFFLSILESFQSNKQAYLSPLNESMLHFIRCMDDW